MTSSLLVLEYCGCLEFAIPMPLHSGGKHGLRLQMRLQKPLSVDFTLLNIVGVRAGSALRIVDCAMQMPELLEAFRCILALCAGKACVHIILWAWQDPRLIQIIDNEFHVREEGNKPTGVSWVSLLSATCDEYREGRNLQDSLIRGSPLDLEDAPWQTVKMTIGVDNPGPKSAEALKLWCQSIAVW